jgi:predicted esterase
MKNMAIYSLTLFLLLGCSTLKFENPALSKSELIILEPRPDIKLKIMILEPKQRASKIIILCDGGPGMLLLDSDVFGSPLLKNPYKQYALIGMRDSFVEAGFVVALPDIPSDLVEYKPFHRIGKNHLNDITKIVQFLKERYSLPIWIAGMSNGTLSAVYAGSAIGEQLHGLILLSSVTRPSPTSTFGKQYPYGVADMNLPSLILPVLIAAHRQDECRVTPSAGAELIAPRLTSSPAVALKYYSGGNIPLSESCLPISAHGFYGIENQVKRDIISFILAN